jgi:hypothetical protein
MENYYIENVMDRSAMFVGRDFWQWLYVQPFPKVPSYSLTQPKAEEIER